MNDFGGGLFCDEDGSTVRRGPLRYFFWILIRFLLEISKSSLLRFSRMIWEVSLLLFRYIIWGGKGMKKNRK